MSRDIPHCTFNVEPKYQEIQVWKHAGEIYITVNLHPLRPVHLVNLNFQKGSHTNDQRFRLKYRLRKAPARLLSPIAEERLMSVLRIILLEDDPAINDSMVLILELAGYDVIPFLSVKSFRHANPPPPDLYLLDRQVNDEDGLTLCRELKDDKVTAHVPVIMISANPDIAALLPEAGGDAFLEKPYSRQELIATIERFIPPPP